MEKSGIVYLMKTVIKGVYKIGISEVSNFEGRMRHLENNGYANVAGLERILAVKTDNYKEKENLLHEIFSKSRIGDTELFAVDENLVKRLFLSLRGEIADGIHIYTCFSRADLEKAYSEYLELFKSESDAEGRKPR
ncbi:TPA: GIY-YIG nuclease family protein [Neisseria meningitidis]